MEHRIRVAAILTTIGLGVSLASLLVWHPLAFILFLVVGVVLIVVAIVYYLISLLRAGPATDTDRNVAAET